MTNIVPFNQAALPAFMQQLAGAANINDQAAAGIGGESIDHISIKGGRFHIIRNGQQPQTLELFALRVIIVHANPGVTKAYYDTPWNPDQDAEAPACSSDDGITPRSDSPRPQCGTCAVCPQNQFGSKVNAQTGKESKACTDKKCIAIVTPGNEAGEMLRLQIPTMAMKGFGAFLRGLPNVPYYAVVTEITFDTTVSYPKIKFRPVDYISEQAFPVVLARHTSDEAKMFAGVAGATAMRALQAPQQAALAAPPAYVQAQPQMIPVQQVPVQQPVQQQFQQPVQQQFQQPVQQQFQQPAQQFVQQQAPVQEQYQQAQAQQPIQQFQQPVVTPAPVAADPSIAAIFQQPQQQAPVQQQQFVQQAAPTGPVHPSGREVGKPSAGKSRRNSAEVAEDDAYMAARNGGAPVQQAPQQAQAQQQFVQQPVEQPVQQQFVQQAQPQAQQPVEQQFGQQPAAQPQQYQQPANQPQVMTGAAVDAFAGWDD
jgi:hypothetical protein